jgi:hypothetical protein
LLWLFGYREKVNEFMKYTGLIAILVLTAVFFGSCRKIQQLPAEPEIEFISFTVLDSTDILGNDCKAGKLKFYFQDGDGDLGIDVAESGESDTTNLFLTLFRKTAGIMVQVPDNDILKPSSYRIPYMERTGQNKILKGDIVVTLLYLFYDPADMDTLRYDFKIKDRADHYSNEESTCEIPLSVNGVYVKR